jgi:hypothetical protein
MNRVLVSSLVALVFVALPTNAGTFQKIDVAAGAATIFQNLDSTSSVVITIQVTDASGNGGSDVSLMKANGTAASGSCSIPEGATMACRFPVAFKESLKLRCNASGGARCSYSLSVP